MSAVIGIGRVLRMNNNLKFKCRVGDIGVWNAYPKLDAGVAQVKGLPKVHARLINPV